MDQHLFNKTQIPASRMVNQLKLMEIQDDKPVILMASRPKLWKGHLILIESLSMIKPDFQCILIGAADEILNFKRE